MNLKANGELKKTNSFVFLFKFIFSHRGINIYIYIEREIWNL